MPASSKVSRWASVKTVAQLLDCSVSEVRQRIAAGAYLVRKLTRKKYGRPRVALDAYGWPVPAAGKRR